MNNTDSNMSYDSLNDTHNTAHDTYNTTNIDPYETYSDDDVGIHTVDDIQIDTDIEICEASLITPEYPVPINNTIDSRNDKRSKLNYVDYEPYGEYEVNDISFNERDAGSSSDTINIVKYTTPIDTQKSITIVKRPIKIIIVGNSSVGKSNLMLKYTKDRFVANGQTTVGVEFSAKQALIDDKQYKLQIWDTAGQELFDAVTRSYYRDSLIAIIVYDVTNTVSFDSVMKWCNDIHNNSNGTVKIIGLIGNKIDDPNRVITHEEGEELSREVGERLGLECKFYESSAKDGINVNTIFTELVRSIEHTDESDTNTIDITDNSYMGGYGCC